MVVLAALCAAFLSQYAPFGDDRMRWGAACGYAFAPFLYPVWGALAFAALAHILRRLSVSPRAFAAGLAVLTVLSVAALDVALGAVCAGQGPTLQDYPYLAANTYAECRRLSREADDLCRLYHIEYGGRYASLADHPLVAATPTGARRNGAYGWGYYAPNGLIAEGYVFSLSNALALLEHYYTAQESLDAYLDSFNRACGTHLDQRRALATVRQWGATARQDYYAQDDELTSQWQRALSAEEGLSALQIEALLGAFAADLNASALLATISPLLDLAGGLDMAALLQTLLGAQTGTDIADVLHLQGARLYLQTGDVLCVRLAGGRFGEGQIIAVDGDPEALTTLFASVLGLTDEQTLAIAAHLVYALVESALPTPDSHSTTAAELLAQTLRAAYWHASPLRPAFEFYAEIPPTADSAHTEGYFAFLRAAADLDRALYEGSLYGALADCRLLGPTIGNGSVAASAAPTVQTVRRLRQELTYLPTVLALACWRNVLLCYGALVVPAAFWAERDRYRSMRAQKPSVGAPNPHTSAHFACQTSPLAAPWVGAMTLAMPTLACVAVGAVVYAGGADGGAVCFVPGLVCALLTVVCVTLRKRNKVGVVALCLAAIVCLGVRWALVPAVSRLSFGIVNGAQMASAPAQALQCVRDAKRRGVLFALLSGALDETYRYEILVERTPDGGFADKRSALLWAQDEQSGAPIDGELYDLVWRYYILADDRYALAVGAEKQAEREAVCRMVCRRIAPTYRRLCLSDIAKNAPLRALLEQNYRNMVVGGLRPLADEPAVALALEGRITATVALRLLLDDHAALYGAADILGEPIEAAAWTIPAADLRGIEPIVDQLLKLVAQDMQLPFTRQALADMGAADNPIRLYVDEGKLHVAVYPTAYRKGVLGYVPATLVHYRTWLTLAAATLPMADVVLGWLPTGWAALFTSQAAAPRPKRRPRPIRTRLERPRRPIGTA